MSKFKQLKGYLPVEGKIRFLGAKSLKDSPRSQQLNFAIETNVDNVINIQAFGWKKADTDDILIQCADGKTTRKVPYADVEWLELEKKEHIIGTSVKKGGVVEELVDIDALKFISENFKNGDSIFVNLKSDVDTYFKTIKWTINKIYPCTDDLDFTSKDFKEENHGVQWVVFDSVDGNTINTYVIGTKDAILPLKFEVSEDIPVDYFNQFESGDTLNLDFELVRTPIYADVEVKPEEKKDVFVPIGKYANAENSNGTFKSTKGYDEKFICVGVKKVNKQEFKIEEIKALLPDSDDDTPF